jgi:hypothetical protein
MAEAPSPLAGAHTFVNIAVKNPSILRVTLNALPQGAAALLRQVNRGMQLAVNHTVETATCNTESPLVASELSSVFPGADKLRIAIGSVREVASMDVCMFLDAILVTTPALVSKSRAVQLHFQQGVKHQAVREAVTHFLSRQDLNPETRH